MRPSGRASDAMRPVTLEPGVAKYAEGSCLAKFGDTHVLCTASVEERVPPFLRNTGKGWVTAEYGMLPRSTATRTDREAARGRQSGRTQEIQRLIGRSLRAVTDLTQLGERQIRIDCDVLQADGGTRTAAVTGSYVALHQAFQRRPRQHAVFGSDPAATLTLEPGRQPFLQRCRHQHVGVAELHEAGTFGVFHDAALERYGTQLVGLSAARPHTLSPAHETVDMVEASF